MNSLFGDRIYIETKSSRYVDVVDRSTDTIIERIGPFAGIGGPYTINGNQTRLYGNFLRPAKSSIREKLRVKVTSPAS